MIIVCNTCIPFTIEFPRHRLSFSSQSCYGLNSSSTEATGTWVCDACNHEVLSEAFQSRRLSEPQCTLCCLRGGALKKTLDGRWAHVVCAVLIPDVYFESFEEKAGIETKQVPKARKRLQCYLCKDLPMALANKGVCVQCYCGRSMHVTCSMASGTHVDVGIWPEPVYLRCSVHRQRKEVDLLKSVLIFFPSLFKSANTPITIFQSSNRVVRYTAFVSSFCVAYSKLQRRTLDCPRSFKNLSN